MAEIHLITGNGAGKTTSAIGVAFRALGHGKKVAMIQFMKGQKTGEYKFAKKQRGLIIKQFGRKGFVNLKKPDERDKRLAEKGLKYAKRIVKKEKKERLFLLILDEINLAARIGLLDKKEVVNFLKNLPSDMFVYLTGRYAPKEFFKIADFVSVIKEGRGKMKKIKARRNAARGIEY